jgi:hypothetical protein
MKSLSKKTRYLIILGSMVFVLVFAGLNLPRHIVPAQSESSPTPTVLATLEDPIVQSGDTEGLIIGASIILVIILLGVLIQRLVLKNTDLPSQE